jgi:hypothetical protein
MFPLLVRFRPSTLPGEDRVRSSSTKHSCSRGTFFEDWVFRNEVTSLFSSVTSFLDDEGIQIAEEEELQSHPGLDIAFPILHRSTFEGVMGELREFTGISGKVFAVTRSEVSALQSHPEVILRERTEGLRQFAVWSCPWLRERAIRIEGRVEALIDFICSKLLKIESLGPVPCSRPGSHPGIRSWHGRCTTKSAEACHLLPGKERSGENQILERVSKSVRVRTTRACLSCCLPECIDSLGEVAIVNNATSSPPEGRALSQREGGEAPADRSARARGCNWWGNRIGHALYLSFDYLGAGNGMALRGPSTHLALDQDRPHPGTNVATQECTGIIAREPLSNLPAASRGPCSAPDPFSKLVDVRCTYEDPISSRLAEVSG